MMHWKQCSIEHTTWSGRSLKETQSPNSMSARTGSTSSLIMQSRMKKTQYMKLSTRSSRITTMLSTNFCLPLIKTSSSRELSMFSLWSLLIRSFSISSGPAASAGHFPTYQIRIWSLANSSQNSTTSPPSNWSTPNLKILENQSITLCLFWCSGKKEEKRE